MANPWYAFGKGNPKNPNPEKQHNDLPPSTRSKVEEDPYYDEEEEIITPENVSFQSPEEKQEEDPKIIEKMVCENQVVIHETDRIINALRQSIENQQAIYGLLEDQLRVSNEQLRIAKDENTRLSEIVRKQHETLSKFQNDVFYRSQKDVIMEIIRIADEVEAIRQANGEDSTLNTEMQGLAKFIDDSLVFSAVKSFRDADGISKDVNLKKQEMSDVVIPTDDPDKDGVLISLRPGYVWRLPWLVANTDVQLTKMIRENNVPQTYEVVIRPELIGVMRFATPSPVVESETKEEATLDNPIDQED